MAIQQSAPPLTRFAWLSIVTAILTIGLKSLAYWLTGSIGLLSDALESTVNLVAAIMALAMLALAARPADEEHAYGHNKAEYFSSVVEGALILVAAISIVWTATGRLINPQSIDQAPLGLLISAIASAINFAVARILLRAGRRYRSITLQADAHHLMTDVWTSIGVLVGVGAVALTGWERIDPLIAVAVAINIVFTGARLVRESALGLLDTALPPAEQSAIREVLAQYGQQQIEFHALRTRQAGVRRFVSMHVLVPGTWTVQRGHQMLEQIEADIRAAVPNATVFTHLESLDDPASWQDQLLDRNDLPGAQPRGHNHAHNPHR